MDVYQKCRISKKLLFNQKRQSDSHTSIIILFIYLDYRLKDFVYISHGLYFFLFFVCYLESLFKSLFSCVTGYDKCDKGILSA